MWLIWIFSLIYLWIKNFVLVCVGVSLMFVLYNLLIFCFFFSLFQVQAIYKSLKESIDRKPDSLKKKKTLKKQIPHTHKQNGFETYQKRIRRPET